MRRSNWWKAHALDVLLGILLSLCAFFLLLLLVILWAISPQAAEHSTLARGFRVLPVTVTDGGSGVYPEEFRCYSFLYPPPLKGNKGNKVTESENSHRVNRLRGYRNCYQSQEAGLHSVTASARRRFTKFSAVARLRTLARLCYNLPRPHNLAMAILEDPEQESLAQTCSPKEWAFVHEYVIDLNGTQAVWRAGCFNVSTDDSAANCASLLLKRPQVKAALAVATAQRLQRTKMTADAVLQEMSLLSHSNVGHYFIDDEGQIKLTEGAPAGAMAAIKSVKRKKIVKLGKGDDGEGSITYEVELTLWDKPTPLKLMGRHVGLFPDKVEVTGKDGQPIETVTEIKRTIVRAAVAAMSSDDKTS